MQCMAYPVKNKGFNKTMLESNYPYFLRMGLKTDSSNIQNAIYKKIRKGLVLIAGFIHFIDNICSHTIESKQHTLCLSGLESV